MSFAVRNDGTAGWRAVDNISELMTNEVFTDKQPANVSVAQFSVEELSAQIKAQRDQLLAIAGNRMGPLQDAVDTENATEEEVESLLRWKRYRIALNRIEKQEKFPVDVEWPMSPDQLK